MPSQPVGHPGYILVAEGTLLLLCALCAAREMPLAVFVREALAALVWALKLAHVQHVLHLSGHLHFLEFLLAKRASCVPSKPVVEAASANERLTLTARRVVFQNVSANRAHELLQHLFELRKCIV